MYLNFNVSDGPLRDKRVRQAIACAMDRQAIMQAVYRDQARLAFSLLPVGHWAVAAPEVLAQYPHDIRRARALLAQAGYTPGTLRLEMKRRRTRPHG